MNDSAIAIVGMAGRFPDARDVDGFWRNVVEARESVRPLGDEALEAAGVSPSLLADPRYVKAGVELPDMEKFDAGFFGFSPLDASLMDPQHRHFLECCWEVLESAGTDPGRFEGSIGVYAGSGHNAYMPRHLLTNPELVEQVGFFLIRHTGNDKDFLATRVSYQFDLRGPSVNVQTACSTSLVAIHLGCQALLSGECDLALAGGVTIELPHRRGYLAREGEILSPDGHCRPFEARSNGTVFGSAAGVVALRRLEDALEDRHTILAVIRGSAINNDGSGKIGYLAPSVDGQAGAISEALDIAEVESGSVGLIEAHGTGTAVGDPIEVAALAQAYGAGAGPESCALGSVKSNIGHTDTAAGVASLIKAVQALRHGQIPPTLHFESPNPEIRFEGTPFYVPSEPRPWPEGPAPRRAGVSSLGVGGTNSHVILEEAPAQASAPPSRVAQLVVLSARSEVALDNASERLAEHVRSHPGLSLADAAYTLQQGRKAFEHRQVLAASSPEELVRRLDAREGRRRVAAEPPARRVAFLLPGGGAQYPDMGRDLYETEPVYRAEVDRLLGSLDAETAAGLRRLLHPEPQDREAAAAELQRPSIQLPLIFVTEFALAQLWRSWGIEPECLIGHSMGENTAACLSGVMSPEDALALVSLRGRLFERVEPGGMLSVGLAAEEVEKLLPPELCVASINAPELCVVSGPTEGLAALDRSLAEREVSTQRIQIDVAAHSAMLDPILDEWLDFLRGLRLSAPRIPFVSNVTGSWIRDEEATDPEYWMRHLRGSVRFAEGVALLLEDPARVLVEVGPGRALSTLAGMQSGPTRPVLHSMRHPDDEGSDVERMLETLGELWMAGLPVDWSLLHEGDERLRIPLPSYAFEHERFWIEPGRSLYEEGETGDRLERAERLDDWFYTPGWKRAPLAGEALEASPVLLLGDDTPNVRALADALESAGRSVVRARAGARFEARSPDAFTIRPERSEDLERVLATLSAAGAVPGAIVHLFQGEPPDEALPDAAGLARELDRGFGCLLALAQAIGSQDLSDPLDLVVVTSGLQQVGGERCQAPLRALGVGAARVIGSELPNVRCRAVDLEPLDPASAAGARQLAQLVEELGRGSADRVLALRGGRRLAEVFERSPLPEAVDASRLRDEGVYLITGGLGGLGLALAEHLGRTRRARLVLVGRRALPPREQWPGWVASRPESDRARQAIEAIGRIEAAGGRVRVESGDVSDAARLGEIVTAAESEFGDLHGVFHTAGVLDDQLAQIKTRDEALRVLAPKLHGTLALAKVEAERGRPFDFLMLYSSVSAIAGLPGQIDYAAASSFLDAFARHHSGAGGTPTLSLAWGPWREVGMAAELARGAEGSEGTALAHPLLERFEGRGARGEHFSTCFSTQRHWLVDEHRLGTGQPLVPGTGYLELAVAALVSQPEDAEVELRDVFLAAPFLVPDDQERTLHLDLDRESGRFGFWSALEEGGPRLEHVRGEIAWAREGAESPGDVETAPAEHDVEALRARCNASERTFDGVPEQPHLRFGARWGCLERVRLGEGEALVELRMPEAFAAELESMRLHPALLDMATGAAHALLPGFDPEREFCVPMSYSRVRSRAPLPPRCLAHLRDRSDPASAEGYGVFDVLLLDEQGRELARFDEFVVKRVAGAESLVPDEAELYADAEEVVEDEEGGGAPPLMDQAIRTDEGLAALERVLAARDVDHVAILPHDLRSWIETVAAPRLAPVGFSATTSVSPELQAELDETAGLLQEHEAVEECVVTAHFDRPGQTRLLVHLEWSPGRHATVSELRRFLRERLPDDRLPHNFVDLEALPRRSDGGIDVSALEDPFGIADDYVEPRTEVERSIAKVWQETLGIDRVGVHDNFFDIGGHSLLAMRAILRMEKRVGVRLNNAIMVLQTLEQIAAECVKRRPELEEAGEGATPSAAVESALEPPAKSGGLAGRLLRAMKRGGASESR